MNYGNYSFDALTCNFNENTNYAGYRNIFLQEAYSPLSFDASSPISGSVIYGNSFEISANYTYPNVHYAFFDLDRSLLSWWRFENSSQGEIQDYSGTENTLINSSGSIDIDSDGKFGSAGFFNRSEEDFANASETNPPLTEYTYSVWFRTNNKTSPFIDMVGKYYNGQFGQFGLYNGKLCMTLDTHNYQLVPNYDSTVHVCSDLTYNDSLWHQAVVSVGSAGTKLYIDGVLIKSNSVYTSTQCTPTFDYTNCYGFGTSKYHIGKAYYGDDEGTYYYDGNLDEVMIFNRVLSDNEVVSLYNSSANFNQTYSSLSYGSHNFRAYAVNSQGEMSQTSLREMTLINPDSSSQSSFGGGFINFSLNEGECYDSDGGLNYFKFGITSTLKNGKYYTYTDYCYEKLVNEHSCSGGSIYESSYSCPNGCSSGGCISEENLETNEVFSPLYLTQSLGDISLNVIESENSVCGVYSRENPKTALASTTFTGYDVKNSIDSNSNTGWYGKFEDNYPKSIRFDMEAQKCIRAVDIYVSVWDLPISLDVQVSNEGTTWSTVLHNITLKSQRTIGLAFPSAIVARYLRVVESSGGRAFGNIQEFKVLSANYSGSEIYPQGFLKSLIRK